MYNIYQSPEGKAETKYVGNISQIKKYQVKGILGFDIPTSPMWAFEDSELTVLPLGDKDIPYDVTTAADGTKKVCDR